MVGSRGHFIAAAALAVSAGCSLLFFSYLRRKFPVMSSVPQDSGRWITTTPSTGEVYLPSSAAKNTKCSSSAGKVKKQVRFADDVKEPSICNKEYGRRRRKNRESSTRAIRNKRIMYLPENRSAVYNGLNRYRSQMATLMIYTA